MGTIHNPGHVALVRALAELADVNVRAAPLIKEQAAKKRKAWKALGNVIIRFVETHGELRESSDKTYWYREMECSRPPLDPGFQGMINKAIGELDWFQLYRPALEHLDKKRAHFITGMGDCCVVLNEKLTQSEAEVIRQSRLARPSP